MSDNYIERRISTVRDIEADEARQDQRDLHISMLVRGAVQEAVSEAIRINMPPPEEREYLRLAVRRAARREELQRAIIDKSLAGLVWAGLALLGVIMYEYIVSHGWKP